MSARTRTARTARRRSLALVVSGALCLLVAAAPAVVAQEAPAAPGSGFGSFSLAANAPVVQVRFEDGNRCASDPASTAGCEGVVPETVSTLAKGPVGFALSSVVWPGTLGGNLGSTIILAGNGSAPEDFRALNSPVRAEARTGVEPSTVEVNDTPPGTTMRASAVPEEVKASADIASSQVVGIGSFGNTTSSTRTAVTGPATAVAEATGRVSDIDIGGIVKIGSITSTAKGTSDGKAATAEGRTVVQDMTVGGVPVTIDDKGLRVGAVNSPLGKPLGDSLNTVLGNAGMTIALSTPTTIADGGNVEYSAGSLIVVWEQPGAKTTTVIGGSFIALSAGEGFDLGGDDGAPLADAAVTGTDATGGDLGTADLGGVGDTGTPLDLGGATTPDLAGGTGEEAVVAAPAFSQRRLVLPDGMSVLTVLLGLAGAGLIAAGLKRLPDRLLEGPVAVPCLLEGDAR